MAIKPSLRLAIALLLLHTSAGAVVHVALMSLATKLVILMPILLSLTFYLARDALLLLPGSWSKISLDQDAVSVTTRDGSSFSGEIAGGTTVTPYFAVLCVRAEGRYFQVSRTIFPDMFSADEFRDLRVRLRFSRKLP